MASETSGPAAVPVPAVSLRGVTKRFGDVVAVDDISLHIADGEFLALLGPSGSGKTTVLRMIAGFEQPTGGHILLGGADVTGVPAYGRDVHTVFQDYALFPHMDVIDNVEYALRVRKVPRHERRARAEEALASVRLEGLGGRRPNQLSGGQRQRVALARALVNRPRVLLLDEPLGALDLKLREEMQVELKELQRRVGITFIFVTHDQEEALTMADRVAVFNRGRIEQIDAAATVYERPASRFVAGFVGTSNVLEGIAASQVLGTGGTWSVRPEKIRVAPSGTTYGDAERGARGTVREVVYAGASTRFVVDLDAGPTWVAVEQNLAAGSADNDHLRGSPVELLWRREHEYALPDGASPPPDTDTDGTIPSAVPAPADERTHT